MDGLTLAIIGIGAALVVVVVSYCLRTRRQGRFQDVVHKALQIEFEQRIKDLDTATHHTVLEALSHFPKLDAQDDDDASPVVARLLRSMDDLMSERDEATLDAVDIHAALLAERSVLMHCESGTKRFYERLDELLRSDLGQVFRVEGADETGDDDEAASDQDRHIPKAGCCYRLCCLYRSWERKKYHKMRRVRYYNFAHRVCCGRTGREAVDVDDEEMRESPMDSGQVQRHYLHSGGMLKRHFAHVTKDAQEFVFVDADGDVMVAATKEMWSKQESSAWLRRCFGVQQRFAVDEHDDAAFFGHHGLREDSYTYLFNIDHLVSTLPASYTLRRTHEAVVMFDGEVKRWAYYVKKKLCTRIASRWRSMVEARARTFLNAADIVHRISWCPKEPPEPSQRAAAQPLRVEPILRKFWAAEMMRFMQALTTEGADVYQSDSVERCCGYCLPHLPQLEHDYSADPDAVAAQLTERLRHQTWLCRIRDDELQCISNALAITKQRISRTLLVRPRRAGAEEDAREEAVRNETPTTPEPPAFHLDDGPPLPPARIDLAFSPVNDDNQESPNGAACCLKSVVGDVVRYTFEELEERLDRWVLDLESECAALFLNERRSGGALAVAQQEIQHVLSKAADDVRKHAIEVSVMLRVYTRTRLLCTAGRAASDPHANENALEHVNAALLSLRDVLLEARDARGHFDGQSSDNPSGDGGDCAQGGMWMVLERPNCTDIDAVSGKRQLLYPWHRVLVSYNYYAQLLQKPPITLQFIYR